MNPATQPNGMSVTPWNWSSARRTSVARSEMLLVMIRRGRGWSGVDRGARALQVERLDKEQAAVGPGRERRASTSRPMTVTRPNP